MRMKRILITLSLSLVMILGISLSAYAAPQLATDADFEFIAYSDAPNTYNIDSTTKQGYFHYKGNKSEVIIPKTIMGNELKDTFRMFYYNGHETQKVGEVAGDNGVPVTKVELREGNSVTNMYGMFEGSQATTLDLSSFDTSNVTNMGDMFQSSQATTLDLSSFNTSKVTNMGNMFGISQATTGYARTTTDANNFNSSSGKPGALTFIVKPIQVTGVTLNKTTASIIKGLTETLTATISPSDSTYKNISWSSSNTSVATVSSTGLVTAIGSGTAIITVTTQDGNKTATCNVTVYQPVTGITLNKSNTNITKGLSETLAATINPSDATNKNITWTSSSTSVATVDTTGKITAISEGTTTITATTEDGEFTATCEVTVSQPVIMTINPASSMLETGETQELTVTIQYGAEEPIDVTNECSWVVANNNKATLTNNIVTAVDSGMTSITAMYQEFQVTSFITIKDYRESDFNPGEKGDPSINVPSTPEREPFEQGKQGVSSIVSDTNSEWIRGTAGVPSGWNVIVSNPDSGWVRGISGLSNAVKVNLPEIINRDLTANQQGNINVSIPESDERERMEQGKQGSVNIVIK